MIHATSTPLRFAPILLLAACDPDALEKQQETMDTAAPAWGIADPALQQCALDALGLEGELLAEDVAGLTELACPDAGIASLDGLEAIVSLQRLTLWENQVADLAPLAGLTGLIDLQLGNNAITDIAPLAGLVALERLGLAHNQISDISPLAGMAALSWLNLDDNQLGDEDLDQLCQLGTLSWLTAEDNAFSDLDALGCLGGEVYANETAGAAGPPAPSAVRAQPALHSLEGWLDGRGSLRVEAWTDQGLYEVIPAFIGALVIEGQQVLLVRGSQRLPVGSLDQGQLSLCEGSLSATCRARLGWKGDGTAHPMLGEHPDPVVSLHIDLAPELQRQPASGVLSGLSNDLLLDYVFASPNQYDAGSCLFMANTGAMEVLLNQRTPAEERVYEGDTDLSERYLMNASDYVSYADMDYVLTDLTYTYNVFGGSLLNRDYPFVADYMKESWGGYEAAEPDDEGAFFTCYYNWLDELPDGWQDQLTPTPESARTIVFLDPDLDSNSVWDVGLADRDVVERIKHELDSKRAPVIVVYNHYLYWHANLIVGYDDELDIGGCPMVQSSLSYFDSYASSYANKIDQHMEEQGGCLDKGAFYVRDSIYSGDSDEPWYSYSDEYNFSAHYSERIVELSYDWVVYLSNHAYAVQRSGG